MKDEMKDVMKDERKDTWALKWIKRSESNEKEMRDKTKRNVKKKK